MIGSWRQLFRPPAWVSAFGTRFMPFADAASAELPLGRLLRLSLFQFAIGLSTALLVGTLNRVMIVELQVPAWWVAVAVAMPLVFAPLRALIGYRSDTHPSALGLRRIPYLWIGTLLLFGGLAIMPFALLLLSEATPDNLWVGRMGAALSFVLVGAGMQVTQTAGMALASDLSSADKRPRVVALLYSMLLLGMVVSSAAFGALLADFGPVRLIQVVQGSAVVVAGLNLLSLWKQEARSSKRGQRTNNGFSMSWQRLMALPHMHRYLWALGLGTAAFGMQDIILEPYGGEILGLNVGMTSSLTALSAGGSLLAFALSARWLARGFDACRMAGMGALIGLPAFACVIFSAPLQAPLLFQTGALLVGLGGGFFSVGMLVCAMDMAQDDQAGLVLGAWGAVQATAAGLAMAAGGVLRDLVNELAVNDWLGHSLNMPATGYSFVYHVEIYMLFVVLVALGPLVRNRTVRPTSRQPTFGLVELPG